jgi:hypothetical protein
MSSGTVLGVNYSCNQQSLQDCHYAAAKFTLYVFKQQSDSRLFIYREKVCVWAVVENE